MNINLKQYYEGYKVIYADPPWSYNKKIGQGVAEEQYPTMTTQEICNLPIEQICAKDAIIYLWVTPPFLPDALKVIDAWGFTFKTVGFTWIKLNKNGQPCFGIGHYTKSNAEYCLIATKGKGVEIVNNTISQIVMSVRERHSQKPKEVYSKIEALHGNQPRLELFSRHKRQGWDCFGNEVPELEQRTI